MSNEITIRTKFQVGDIVTLKAMAASPGHGPPQRLCVRCWEVGGDYDAEGKLVLEIAGILYWCRALRSHESWGTIAEQSFTARDQLRTGEILVRESELELYVEPKDEKGSE